MKFWSRLFSSKPTPVKPALTIPPKGTVSSSDTHASISAASTATSPSILEVTEKPSGAPKHLQGSLIDAAQGGDAVAVKALSASQSHEWQQPIRSDILPDFPLNPQNLCYVGAAIKDSYLLNLCIIAQCIFSEFEDWKTRMGREKWPGYANRELQALTQACAQMRARVSQGCPHYVDIKTVERLIHLYIERVTNDPVVYRRFTGREFTLFFLAVDFAHTIGCGDGLKTALEWFA